MCSDLHTHTCTRITNLENGEADATSGSRIELVEGHVILGHIESAHQCVGQRHQQLRHLHARDEFWFGMLVSPNMSVRDIKYG